MSFTKRARSLCLILIAYLVFASLLFVNYGGRLPYQITAALAVVNFVLVGFQLRTLHREVTSSQPTGSATSATAEADRKISRLLLVPCTILYFGLFLYGLVYGYSMWGKLPTFSIVAGELINAAVLIALLQSLRDTFRDR
jgi:uncharacterized membrane protein